MPPTTPPAPPTPPPTPPAPPKPPHHAPNASSSRPRQQIQSVAAVQGDIQIPRKRESQQNILHGRRSCLVSLEK
ncbi:hypothetical protein Pmani_025597 [Petrolisthes manimaculis]|uniref:Uncharacterized protein n=1 Tax=Petrolisthes manimaculis TaxID=1843537 RepID=A0AAE1TXI5_9EUCA|nr:hypothetical protein Pmani_025597 [Petrolisthes manimaculis]